MFKPLLLALAAISLLPSIALAQQTGPTTDGNVPATQRENTKDKPPAQTESDREILKQEESQRILGLMPQFGVTNRHNAPPLTRDEKFHLFYKQAFDPFVYATAGLQAGLSQAEDEFPGYGQGAAGYGKRYGASLADEVSSNFFSNFFYPALLKQDPRYFRLGEGSFRRRILYSAAQEFSVHNDHGGRSFAWENVLGAFSSGGLSNVYYPKTDRGFSLTMSRSLIAMAYGSVGGLVSEFWPDVQRKLQPHQKPAEDH